jgi:hypothetical protein
MLKRYGSSDIITLAVVLSFFLASTSVDAFLPTAHRSQSQRQITMAGGFMDDVGKFFDDLSRKNDRPNVMSDIVEGEEIDGIYTGSKRIITIPAKTMKSGGLRLYCNLYLMGVQNTPERKCWKASCVDNSEVNLRYTDLSGSIIIQFTDDGITIDRLGSAPSTKYLMHESIVLNGFLDELHEIVYGGEVSPENRLLTLVDVDVIEKARGAISFS